MRLSNLGQISALPYKEYFRCFSQKIFAENKLSPSLISLSPLFKLHLSFLQQTPVRSSHLLLRSDQPELEQITLVSCLYKVTKNHVNFASPQLPNQGTKLATLSNQSNHNAKGTSFFKNCFKNTKFQTFLHSTSSL